MFRSVSRAARSLVRVSASRAPSGVAVRGAGRAPGSALSAMVRTRFFASKHHPEDYDDDEDEDEDEDEDFDEDDDEDDDDYDYDDWNEEGTVPATVGDLAPLFSVEQVLPNGEIKSWVRASMDNRFTIMLFYPANFTFVCPTELTAFSDAVKEFNALDCDIVGVSTDQIHSHVAWLNLPRKFGGVEGLEIPLAADPTHELSEAFGVYDGDAGQARRATVIVDKGCRIVHKSVNLAPVGRSVEEALRLIKAFEFVDKFGDQVCPASWTPGKRTITSDHQAKMEFFKAEASDKEKKAETA